MLDFIQLMRSDTSSQQLEPTMTGDDQESELNESSFILTMAQMLINGEELEDLEGAKEGEVVADKKQADNEPSAELQDIENMDPSAKNQAMAWINSDEFLPPSENSTEAELEAVQLPVETNAAKITAKNAGLEGRSILAEDAEPETMALDGQEVTTDLASKTLNMNKIGLRQAYTQQSPDKAEMTDFSQALKTPMDTAEPVDLSTMTVMTDMKSNAPVLPSNTPNTVVDGQALAAGLQNNLVSNTSTPAQTQMQSLNIPVQVSDEGWGDQFNQHIVWLGQQNIKSAQIKLNPPELGPLDITIKIDKQSADLTIQSHSLQVKDALDQALPRLREMMTAQGLNLGEVNIDARSRQQDQQQSQYQAETMPQYESNTEQASEIEVIKGRVSKGLIDYFA